MPALTAGIYRIRVNDPSDETRPVPAAINGTQFNASASGIVKVTWCTSPLVTEVIGDVALSAGTHVLRLSCGSIFPHLQRILLQRVQ